MAAKLEKKKKQLLLKGNKLQVALACTDLAEYYKREGRYEESKEEYKMSAKLYLELDNPMSYAQSNRMLAEVCLSIGEFDEALTYEQIHLDIARKENDQMEEQRALCTLGRALLTKAISDPENIDKKTLEDALESFTRSLRVCDNLTNISKKDQDDMRVRLYNNIGVIKDYQDDFNGSIDYINKSIALAQKHDIFDQIVHGYYLLGISYCKQEQFKESLSKFNSALQIAEKMDDKVPQLCTVYLSKAETLAKMGELSTAKQLLVTAYKLKTPNIADRKSIEQNLKIVAAMCNAEDTLIATPLYDNKKRKKLYEILGDGATALKIFSRAIFYYEKMKECSEACGESGKDLSPVYISLAQCYKDKKQYKLAYEYFKKDYEVSRSNPEDSYSTLLQIAHVLELGNNTHEHIVATYNKARKEAIAAKNPKFEKKVICQFIEYLKKKEMNDEITELKQQLSNLNYNSDSDTDSEDPNNPDVPEIGNDINIEDLLMEESDNELENNPRQSRRRVRKSCVKLNRLGESTLHVACKKGNLILVKSLLNQKHPVNIRDNSGWLPIHEACNFGHVDVVRELISNGALINDRDGKECSGVTPLHDACANGHLEVVELMLNSGASPIIVDDANETPYDYLMSWKYENNVDPEKETLFNSVVSRMKEALEKVGRNIDYDKKRRLSGNDAFYYENSAGHSNSPKKSLKVLLPKKSPQIKPHKSPSTSSQKISPRTSQKSPYAVGNLRHSVNDDEESYSSPRLSRHSSFNDDKRLAVKRNLNLTSDTNKDENLDVNSAACYEYRRAIEGLRNRIPEQTVHNSPNRELQSAFVSDEEFDEENWLEDDLAINQAKKRKKNSKIQQNFLDTNGIRNINSISTIRSKTTALYTDNDQENNESNDFNTPDSSKSFKYNKRKRSQTSLLDSGFSRSDSSLSLFTISPVTLVDKICAKTHKKQPKISNFVNNVDTTEQESPVYHQKEKNNQNINKILPVNVRIENKLWRIPVTFNEVNELTIGWLASEAAKRYYKQEGILPSLQLLTQEGAILMNEDPLSMVFVTDTKAEELQSNIVSWNLPPLQERYIEACNSLKIDPCSVLKKQFEECQRSLNLILSNVFSNEIQLPPFFRAINRQNNLQVLDLSQNNLCNDGIKQLCSVLPSLIQLRTLNLSQNSITVEGIRYLSEIFTNVNESVMENLTELILSFNSFGAETLQYFEIILLKLKLRVFDLCGCNLPENMFQNYRDGFKLNLDHLEYLDISYNDMSSKDIIRFISFLNYRTISTLNVSCNTNVKISGITHELAQNIRKVNKISMKNLNLAKCKVVDSEVSDLMREMTRANEIEVLNMSFNEDLTSLSLKSLLEHNPSISSIILLGCSNILSNFDLTLLYSNDNNETNFIKSLKLSVESGKKICEIKYLISLWQEKWQKKAQITTLLETTMYFTVKE